MPNFLTPIVLLLASMVGACSSQQVFDSGQSWQRNECHKIIDSQQRSRCLASTSTTYEEYQRQAEKAQKGG